MRFRVLILATLLLGASAGGGLAQPPGKENVGLGEAKELNAAVAASNDAAENREDAATAAWRAQEDAKQKAFQEETARYQAQVEAIAAHNREIEQQQLQADAEFAADRQAYQAEVDAAARARADFERTQADYNRAQAEYDACMAGQIARCPPGTGPGLATAPKAPVAPVAAAPAAPGAPPPIVRAAAPLAPPPTPLTVPVPTAPPASAVAAEGPITCTPARAADCISQRGGSIVMVMRRLDPGDPLTRYGAGFAVVVMNQGAQPFIFSPANVTLTGANGRRLTVLTETALQSKAQSASRGSGLGSLLAVGAAVAGASGNGNSQSAALANNLAQSNQQSAQRRSAEGQAAAAGYSSSILRPMVVPPGATSSGQIIVEGIDDKAAVTLTIQAGGETHTVRFVAG